MPIKNTVIFYRNDDEYIKIMVVFYRYVVSSLSFIAIFYRHVVNSLNFDHSLVVIRCSSCYYHQRCMYTGALLLPTKKRHHQPPQKYHFWGRLFSDLVQFLLRNFAKESKASLKAFVGGIHERGNTL